MKFFLARKVLIVIVLLTASNGFCQERLRMAEKNKLNKDKLNVISIFPAGVFNPLDPIIQIGYDRKVKEDVILQLSGGIILPHSVFGYIGKAFPDSENYRFSGYKFMGETKYIISESKSGRHNFFCSMEAFYKKEKNEVNAAVLPRSSSASYLDYFTINKEVIGGGLKFGKQFMFGRIVMEFNVGLGLTYNNVKQSDRDNTGERFYWVYRHIHRQGEFYRMYVPLHYKIGYRFN